MPPLEFKSGRGISLRAGNTMVSGPGQKRAINASREPWNIGDDGAKHVAAIN